MNKIFANKYLIFGIFVFACILFVSTVQIIRDVFCINAEENFRKDKPTVIFVTPQLDYPVWLQARQGFEDAMEEFGFYGAWRGQGNCDIDAMLSEIDKAVSENADAIITCPLEPQRFTHAFEAAREKGSTVLTLCIDMEGQEQIDGFIGCDFTSLGERQAQELHQKAGDSLRIGVIMSGKTVQNQVEQVQALEAYIGGLPDARIVDTIETLGDPVQAMSNFEQMMNQHPEINAVFGTEGGGWKAIGEVVKRRGLTDQLTIIGMDPTEGNLEAIREGTVYGVMNQNYYGMGYLAGKYAYEKASGKSIPRTTYIKAHFINSAAAQPSSRPYQVEAYE